MGLTATYVVFLILITLTLCRPLAAFWDKTIFNSSCGNQQLVFLVAGVWNLVLDVVTVILPMPMLWGLQMKTSKKLGLTALFGMGFT